MFNSTWSPLNLTCLQYFKSNVFFQDMLDQLRAIFDQIIKFQATQDTLFSRALFELELRKKKTDEIKENTEEVGEN